MATFSKIIGVSPNNDAFKLEVVWHEVTPPDIANNKSTVIVDTAKVIRLNSSAHPNNRVSDATLTINGKLYTSAAEYSFVGATSEITVFQNKSVVVPHNTDGTKKITISFSFNGLLDNWYPNGSVSKEVSLSTIPRADDFTLSSTTFTLDNDETRYNTVSLTNPSLAYHKGTIIYNGTESSTKVIGGDSFSTRAVSAVFANKFPTDTASVSATYRLDSYATRTGTSVGYKTTPITLVMPREASYIPTFSSQIEPYSWLTLANDYARATGEYLAEVTRVRTTINGISAKYGANYTRGRLSVINEHSAAESTASDNTPNKAQYVLNSDFLTAGSKTIMTRVDDSRGLYAEKSVSLVAKEWTRPTITCNIRRTDESIIISDIVVSYHGPYEADEVEYISPGMWIRYREKGASSWSYISNVDWTGGSVTIEVDKKRGYDVEVWFQDAINDQVKVTAQLPSAQVDFHMKDAHARFGTFVDESKGESFECDWDAYFGGGHFYIKDANDNYHDIIEGLRGLIQ